MELAESLELCLQLGLSFGKEKNSLYLRQAYPPRLGKDYETEREAAVKKAHLILEKARLGYPAEKGVVVTLGDIKSYSKTFGLQLHVSCPLSPRMMNYLGKWTTAPKRGEGRSLVLISLAKEKPRLSLLLISISKRYT